MALTGFRKLLNPLWLTGPLFDKELRVSARRKRNYLLRFLYVAGLTAFVVVVWLSVVESQASTTFQKSRMAVAGKTIVNTIVTFQFAATQLIAVIMLSTSISDEIYNRTLGLLMTTPLGGFQIVMGKLFSKLLQLLLLLAISLPLLAIVRIFGGVPWSYVFSSVCITLTAMLFAGALSLYFSIRNRRAYVVIIKTIVALGFFFGLLPRLIGVLLMLPMTYIGGRAPQILSHPVFWSALSHLSPFTAMSYNMALMMSPRALGGGFAFHWPVHCAFMLGLSILLITRCGVIVRRVAQRQAAGELDRPSKRKRRRRAGKSGARAGQSTGAVGVVRRVTGSPVLWKDLRAPLIRGAEGRNSIIGFVITVAALLATYVVWAREGYLDEDFAHISYVVLFVVMAMLFHIVFSATSITSEKESRAWPILLATSMDDKQILVGKAAAVFRRCLPVWFLLAGHVVIFVLMRFIHVIAIVHLLMLVVWLVVFLTCSGLYFSARFKRTTSAVVASFALALVLWAVVPTVSALIAGATRNKDILAVSAFANPAVQAGVIMAGAGGRRNAHADLADLKYHWLYADLGIGSTTAVLLITMLVYVFFGLLFAWRATCRFRRNVF